MFDRLLFWLREKHGKYHPICVYPAISAIRL